MHTTKQCYTLFFLQCLLLAIRDSNGFVATGSTSRLRQSTLPSPGWSQHTDTTRGNPVHSSVSSDDEALDFGSFFSSINEGKKAPDNLQTSSIGSIVSAAMLITANTVGAGTMALPDVAGSVGMAYATPIFLSLYAVNLLSGTVISEVAIRQYESQSLDSSAQEPSSLKDLSDMTLGNLGGTFIAGMLIFVNWCVLSYCLMRSGQVISEIAGGGLGDASVISVAYTALVAGLVSTVSNQSLCKISSAAVTVFFTAFAGLMVPGLMQMQDPFLTLVAPGTFMDTGSQSSLIEASMAAMPIVLTCMVFQNIVPTVTKMLNYDRSAVRTAMAIGSGIPVLMYLSWCFACLGGGIQEGSMGSGLSSSLLHAFGMATIVGSSVGGTMSTSNEFQSILSRIQEKDDVESKASAASKAATSEESDSEDHTPMSVALAMLPPLAAGLAFSGGDCFTESLSVAGQFGSPVLYGVVPVVLALKQSMDQQGNAASSQEENRSGKSFWPMSKTKSKAEQAAGSFQPPGDVIGLASLGACSVGFLGQQLLLDVFATGAV
jgi:tyrosine-specific transport protein